jgi:uncharacterized protein
MALLVDTGILYALADEDDEWHERAVEWLDKLRESLAVPVTVLPEVCYLLHTRLGAAAERRFMESVVAGELPVEPLAKPDWARIVELLEVYPDLGFVDVSVVAMAERLAVRTLATTDRRHFRAVRPAGVGRFTLVP